MKCDNIYPATQFHFSTDEIIPREKVPAVIAACKFPMAGLVAGNPDFDPALLVPAIQVFGRRIIITTQHNIGVDDERIKEIKNIFMEAISQVLV
jgi:hypothetical protein